MQAIVFDLDHTIFATEDVLHAGVADLLAILRSLGVQIAGLSSADYRVLVRLDEAGIRNAFDHVLCADQTLEPKAVSGLHHLLSNLGVAPHEAALVSHAHADILLGKDAGMASTIGVSHGIDATDVLREAGADHIVDDIPTVLDVLE